MQDKFGVTFDIFGRDFAAINPRIWDSLPSTVAN
jgi:hypothetical protein